MLYKSNIIDIYSLRLQVFEYPMTILQSDEPQIHKLRRILTKLHSDVLAKFITPSKRYVTLSIC